MSSRSVLFAAAARRDLRAITQYTSETWGDAQAVAFGRSIENALARLVEFPELGRRRDDIGLGLRGFTVGHHLIIYRIDDSVVVVRRVVHVRLNVRSLSDA